MASRLWFFFVLGLLLLPGAYIVISAESPRDAVEKLRADLAEEKAAHDATKRKLTACMEPPSAAAASDSHKNAMASLASVRRIAENLPCLIAIAEYRARLEAAAGLPAGWLVDQESSSAAIDTLSRRQQRKLLHVLESEPPPLKCD